MAQNDNTGGESAVTAAAEQLRLLMTQPDEARLGELFADALSYGHSDGKVESKASFIGDLMSGASDFVTITISDQTVWCEGELALVRHTLVAKTNDGGKPGAVKLKVLLVWRFASGRWQLLGRQAVRLAS